MNNKKIFIVASILFVVGLLMSLVFGGKFTPANPRKTLELPERNDTALGVPVLYNYGTKVVYTTDTTVDKNVYIDDCSTRGGTFSVCGNTCEPGSAVCSNVCALTCSIEY